MIEKGKICTIWPDMRERYKITEVKSKTITIVIDNLKKEVTQYFVDLKQVDGATEVSNVPINNINLLPS